MRPAIQTGRAAFAVNMVALAYGVALLAWVAAVPAFDGQTLLEYGGPASLAITSQPLFLSLAMWWLLRRRCTSGSAAAAVAAWGLGALFLVWSVLGALTAAAGAFPAAVLLLVATSLTPRPDSRTRTRAHVLS